MCQIIDSVIFDLFPYQIWVSCLWSLPRFTFIVSYKLVSVALYAITILYRYLDSSSVITLTIWCWNLSFHINIYKHRSLCKHGLSSTLLMQRSITCRTNYITKLIFRYFYFVGLIWNKFSYIQ